MSELLTMLNAKSQRYEVAGGGIAQLTPDMVASALAGLPQVPYQLGLVIHCDALPHQLKSEMLDGAYKRFGPESLAEGVAIAACAALAIYKVTQLGSCKSCNGTGTKQAQRQCQRCNGTGYAKISERVAAQRVGCTRHQWRERYEKIFTQFVGDLEMALSDLDRHIRKKLR